MTDRFYVTTPIYYINDTPHIGSAYTTIVADILAIWHRMNKEDVFFLTGLDENSIKTVQAAEKAGIKDVGKYANEMADKWKAAWKAMGFTNDDFIRTTEERHRKNVIDFFKRVNVKGDIYKGTYEGLYCEACEEFKLERECPDGKCPIHGKDLKRIKEDNYYFKLSKYRDRILKHIEEHPDFIKPAYRRSEIINFLKQGLLDTSISRPHLKWGIEFPLDRSHRFWVWFDALINYLSPKGYWPAQAQLMAKDIARFHCITWVGMLMSAEYELPETMYVHGFLTVDGRKMSKSLGNVVDPVALSEKYSTDALRYYLMRDISIGEDGDFSEKALQDRLNNEIMANYSNLFYRVTSFIEKNFGGMVPEKGEYGPAESAMLDKAGNAVQDYERHMKNIELTQALAVTVDLSAEVNKYIQDKEPWKIIKTDKNAASKSLNLATNLLRTITLMYYPFMPNRCGEALKALGVRPQWWNVERPIVPAGHKITPVMLFKKVELSVPAKPAKPQAQPKPVPKKASAPAHAVKKAEVGETKRQAERPTEAAKQPGMEEKLSAEIEKLEQSEEEMKGSGLSDIFISAGAEVPKQITMKGEKKNKKSATEKKPDKGNETDSEEKDDEEQ